MHAESVAAGHSRHRIQRMQSCVVHRLSKNSYLYSNYNAVSEKVIDYENAKHFSCAPFNKDV